MNELCIAKSKCKSVGSALCDTACQLFMDIRYQIELSSIPKKHQKCLASELPESFYALQVFKKFTSNIVGRISGGQGLYLWSSVTGTGKSTTACAVAIDYIIERLKLDLREGIRTPQLVKFVNVPDFLDDLRRGINNDDDALKAVDLMETLKRVPLVIFDDFGAEKISEWSRERLLTVISERYDNERSIFFTSNIALQEVQVILGSRIRSRVEGMGVPIEFKGRKDWRLKL